MGKEDWYRKSNSRIERSIKYRGEVLDALSVTEQIMNMFISEYFCGHGDDFHIKKMQFVSTIFGKRGLGLMEKYHIMVFIWKHSYKDSFTQNEGLIKSLKDVIELRNVLAHMPLDPFEFDPLLTKEIDEDFDLMMFAIEKYEMVEKRIKFSDKVIEDTLSTLDGLNNALMELIK